MHQKSQCLRNVFVLFTCGDNGVPDNVRKGIKEPSDACGECIDHSQYRIQYTKRA